MTAALEKREVLPVPAEFFQLSERQDETQILAEMRGELLDAFIYRINLRGREITNLSYAGIREAIRRRGGVEITEYKVEDVEDEFRAIVKARDHVTQVDVVGASTCKKTLPFAYTIALNKAERNAFRKLIPEKLLALLIAEYQKTHPQRTATTTEVPVASSEGPASPASASDLTNQALSALKWNQSEKLPALSTIPVNESSLRVPILKLLYDRLSASTTKSWKLADVTYKLSRNDEGSEWLQKWSSP